MKQWIAYFFSQIGNIGCNLIDQMVIQENWIQLNACLASYALWIKIQGCLKRMTHLLCGKFLYTSIQIYNL